MKFSNSSKPLGLTQIFFYASTNLGTLILLGPLAVLQGIYAKDFGLELTAIAAVIFVGRLFDAVSDPVIGYLSDRWMTKTGTRKHFIAFGGVLLVVSGYFLYVPPEGVTVAYFAAAYISIWLAFTLIEIPHLAWGAELSNDPKTRSRIYAARSATGYCGLLIFFFIPLLPIFETNEVTPETLKWTAISVGTLIFPLIYICLKKVPDGSYLASRNKENFRLVVASIIANKPLLVFVFAYFLFTAGTGMWFAMLFIFIDSFLGFGERFTLFFLLALTASVLGSFVWHWLSYWLSKKQAFVLGAILVLVSVVSFALLTPGGSGDSILLFIMILGYFGFAAINVFAPMLVADIVDYGTLKFGVDRAGTYFSVYAFMTKTGNGLGAAVGMAVAGVCGFDPSEAVHSAEGVWGLQLATAYIPAALITISLCALMRLSINAKRHDIIRRRLESLEARLARDVATYQ